MILVWSGYGFLVAVITFASSLLVQLLVNAMAGDPTYYQSHRWPLMLALWFAAGAVWRTGDRLGSKPERVLVEQETGFPVRLRPRHTLFFIEMRYWGPILFVLGVLSFFTRM